MKLLQRDPQLFNLGVMKAPRAVGATRATREMQQLKPRDRLYGEYVCRCSAVASDKSDIIKAIRG